MGLADVCSVKYYGTPRNVAPYLGNLGAAARYGTTTVRYRTVKLKYIKLSYAHCDKIVHEHTDYSKS